jgi:UDP-2,3-diacylglucosamine pyrophosphatase LpxH
MSSRLSPYQQQIARALEQTYKDTQAQGRPYRFRLGQDRWIILSDQHRGARNGADDFQVAERAYNAALAYYYEMGHTLVVLGDVEELWEERPAAVMAAYAHSLSLEAKFHQAGRYLRFWGNHDDDWSEQGTVDKYLGPLFGAPALKVWESLLVPLMDEERELGQLLLLHGHQGTTASDRFSPLSRWLVRNFWRRIQKITKRSLNTPAHNWELRDQHNIALYSWAQKQSRLILIAGHTHRPVFASQSHPAQLLDLMEKLRAQFQADPGNLELQDKLARTAAELEWVRAQEQDTTGDEGATPAMRKPCYFNTGCCSYLDGDITGLELIGEEIRLVRLPNKEEQPQPQILARAMLRNVLARL